MEKKKLKKLTINKMNEFPVIGEEEQMSLKGGEVVPYTWEQMEQMMEIGDWSGGYVEGIGYVGAEVTVYGSFCEDNVFGCCQCPSYATGPGFSSGDAEERGYRWGVAINHWLYH